MNKKKRALLSSVISLVLCFSMLLSTTYAWFTDSVTSTNNIIQSGNLDVELEYWDSDVKKWKDVKQETPLFEESTLWEPGHTQVVYLRVANEGTLALKYQLGINIVGESTGTNVKGDPFKLSDSIYMGVKEDLNGETDAYATREDAVKAVEGKSGIISTGYSKSGDMAATADKKYLALVVYMPTTVENEANYKTGTEAPKITLGIKLVATQKDAELDSFGSDYDAGAELPKIEFLGGTATAAVTATAENKVASDVKLQDKQISGTVPAGALLEQGVTEVTLNVTLMEQTTSNVATGKDESMVSVDVHVAGLSKDNKEPVVVTMQGVLVTGLNEGNLDLYHVEQSGTNKMTQKFTAAEVKNHNDFYYDPATGDVTVAMATFSEITLLSNTVNAWNGAFDYSWYTNAVMPADDEAVTEYVIANADQLAGFGAIVGGMDGQTQDSFAGKTVKLIADINLGDKESENNPDIIFYPIGYYNSEGTYERTNTAITSGLRNFEGTFDGNGHTISNFYQNTWEMKGDHNWYSPEEQYYRDGMGLFGRVYGGTVRNLTVKNFSSDGEIATTGVIAAYAEGATFENIAIFDCNPRVYNIGNGGIVGCVGWYAKEANLKTTFENITVDDSNKISALWGSYDVACGGIVGQYYPTSGQTSAGTPKNAGIDFENCHVSAQMDVYNDVCANYQYYAYRYAGMMVGTNKNMETDSNGYTVPETDKYHAENCTVHFGEWNDYYYCELVANSLASYTHDHQFSRLEQIQNVSEIQDANGNWNKTGNFILMTGKTPTNTCYHIMKDANGNLYEHKHDVADATNPEINEVVNGETVLKENNQRIYLPFNQLFTGYGWGVKHVPVTDYEENQIKILDREIANSVKKFEGKATELANSKEYKIGDIFSFVNNGVELVPGALTVTVTNLDENNPVSAELTRDTQNWENGTLTLDGTGKVQITIQDYYFCTPTTITVTVTARQDEVKFEKLFTKDFLYRVGNASGSTVALGTMFNAVDEDAINDSTVAVAIETVAGNATGVYTADTNTWTAGTVQFSGTGVVKVTITDNDYCIPTELYLEVVDATNLTSATGTTTGGNFVLLCDVNASNYVNYWNCTLYGNGFTYSLNGAPTAYNSKQGHGVLITKNATLDNLVIVGDVYNSYGAYTNQDYYNAAVDVLGETTIKNCYIANCAAPVLTRADVTINDTTLYGGTVANLIIKSGTATLENVTTANYDDGRNLVGMGIVIHSDATESTKLILNGDLTQYNFISEANTPTDSNAKILYNAMFNSSCSQYHFGTSPNRYVNAGIISMTANFNGANITDNANTGYTGSAVTVNSVNGYVYTQLNTSGSVNNNYDAENDKNKSKVQGFIEPEYSFDHTKNYVAKADGLNDYCYEEGGIVNISMDDGDEFSWDTSILAATKNGQSLDYTVSMNGTDYTGKNIDFNKAGSYIIEYTYTDDSNFVLKNGEIATEAKTYTKTVSINVAVVKAAWKNAEIKVTNTAMSGIYVMSGDYDYSYKMKFLDCVTITDYDESGNESTVDLSENIKSTSFVDKNGANPGKFDAVSVGREPPIIAGRKSPIVVK